MTKQKRAVYRVLPSARTTGWAIQWPTGKVSDGRPQHAVKAYCIAKARAAAIECWFDHGIPSQLVIHKADGRIQTEHTYGKDPRKTKG